MSDLYVAMASCGKHPVDREDFLVAVCDDEARACAIATDADDNGAGGWVGADTWITVWRAPPLNAIGDGREIDWRGQHKRLT